MKRQHGLVRDLSNGAISGWLKMQDRKMTEITRPENPWLENDGLKFDGPEQHTVMSLVQEHMHTLKTVPIFLCRQIYFETKFIYLGPQICSC